ncbi:MULTISPECIES: toxin-antitoxin system HicB family antitoxin [unclassified Rhodococcus (in: high G+C Gram-positive bacteria)]|uniref:toxin-antitoxin system HicB family antitoxin n=1 Tax=unclassified Rhodococcus (in: high G+C Gram-positive bacteria) TaxID=192944 RepID=UPI0016398591|nr:MULTISPECIES: toxin-antitoxin system HicB family antitoxin [unclassified Rhodococcus (in: high G+C Gram-positive bacteria)]MBC2643854.1 toxin-antitoxin system HicB family antitoxin [Rhodococcus sp. 3A]MBC2891405.1 toxin-antitoxin system HicB family antitoxin [Rhodococcus sp. 4CII]
MDLGIYVSRLRDDLTAAAALGDEQTRATAAALAAAVEPAARLLLLSALTDFAGEVSSELGNRTVGVRLDGTEVAVDVHRTPPTPGPDGERAATAEDLGAAFDNVTGDISRVTLRLMDQIKSKAEEAASANGVSLNSWVSQAVQGALKDQMRRNGRDNF